MVSMIQRPERASNQRSKVSWHQYNSGIGYRIHPHRGTLSRDLLLQAAFTFLLKFALIGLLSVGFLFCTSVVLTMATSVAFKIVALAAWSCGFVPICHYLWNR